MLVSVKEVRGCVDFLPNQQSPGDSVFVNVCVWVCVAQANNCELTSPDNSLCLRMASFIRSYVTSSVQFTRAFLVMLGNVPEGNGYFNHY